MAQGASVHPPVTEGKCTSCHNPHGSAEQEAPRRRGQGALRKVPRREPGVQGSGHPRRDRRRLQRLPSPARLEKRAPAREKPHHGSPGALRSQAGRTLPRLPRPGDVHQAPDRGYRLSHRDHEPPRPAHQRRRRAEQVRDHQEEGRPDLLRLPPAAHRPSGKAAAHRVPVHGHLLLHDALCPERQRRDLRRRLPQAEDVLAGGTGPERRQPAPPPGTSRSSVTTHAALEPAPPSAHERAEKSRRIPPHRGERAEPHARPLPLQGGLQNRLRPPDGDARPGGGHVHHGHHLPRRPAGAPALHPRSGRPPVQPDVEARRTQRGDPPVRVLPLPRRRPRGRPPLPGARPALPADHRLDPRHRQGPEAGARDEAAGDGHADLGERLPHLPQARVGPEKGPRELPRRRQGGARVRHRAALPLRGHHPRRHLRLLRALRDRADEALRGGARPDQDPPLRHDGLRRALRRRRAAAQRAEAGARDDRRRRRPRRAAGMARPQRLAQGADQRDDRLALRLRRRQRRAARLRRAHRQHARRRADHRVHPAARGRQRHRHDGDHRHPQLLRAGDGRRSSRRTTRWWAATSTSRAPASTRTG